MPKDKIKDEHRKVLEEIWKTYPNVVGFSLNYQKKIVGGQETEEPCLRIYVSKKVPKDYLTSDIIIPSSIDGIKTDVVEIGEVKILPFFPLPKAKVASKTEKVRPVVLGVSIGNERITAGCLTKDTLVLGNPEIKTITEFKEGDMVYVFDDNGIVKRKVKTVFDNGVKDVYLLRTQTGREIKATDNHPFLVARKVRNEYYEKYKRALELRKKSYPDYKIADLIDIDRRTVDNWISRKHVPKQYRWGLTWASLKELKSGDYIVVLKESPVDGKPYKLPDIEKEARMKVIPNLPKETDNDLMWFFGYYLADGYIFRNGHKQAKAVGISEGNKEKANELISKLKKYGIYSRYSERKKSVLITSTYLAKLIEKLGFSGNAHTKKVPDWVLQLPKEQIKSFIEGFIFGDGYKHKSKTSEIRYGIEICNYELLKQIQFLSQMVGWRTTGIRYRKRHSVMKDGRIIEGDIYSLDIYLPTLRKSRGLKGGLHISSSFKVPEPFGLDRIIEIKYLGKENTYDLEIDGEEHNFIANNIVVHNSCSFLMKDKSGNVVVSSNAHVFTDGDPSKQPEQIEWRKILQPGCYSEDTEVLTREGWKRFSEITGEEEIMTLNPKTNEIEYQKPTKVWKYYYEGKMVLWEGQMYNLLVTPEHNVWCRIHSRKQGKKISKKGENNWSLRKASDLLNYEIEFSKTGIWKGENKEYFELPKVDGVNTKQIDKIPMDLWLKFFGWWISEGSLGRTKAEDGDYLISIRQCNEENLKEIADIIKQIGWRPNVREEHGSVSFHSKQLYHYLLQFGHAKDKFIPKEFKQLSPDKIRMLLTTLFKGDGSFVSSEIKENIGYREKYRGAFRRYATKSKQLADDVLELLIKIGLSGKVTYDRKHDIYWVGVVNRNLTPRTTKSPKLVDYKGFVYDVTVPNHILMVRRNGNPIWSGNSYDSGTIDDWVATYLWHKPIIPLGDKSNCPIGKIVCGTYNFFSNLLGRKTLLQPVIRPTFNKIDFAVAIPFLPSYFENRLFDEDNLNNIASIGLLFAGSETSTIVCKMTNILQEGYSPLPPFDKVAEAKEGITVYKTGRTTCKTSGTVLDSAGVVNVSYGNYVATFEDVIISDMKSAGGDSGSPVWCYLS